MIRIKLQDPKRVTVTVETTAVEAIAAMDAQAEVATAPAQPATLRLNCLYLGPHSLSEWLKSFEHRTTVDALMEVVEGWRGPQDEEGNDLPFSRAHLALVLDQVEAAPTPEGEQPTLFAALVDGYVQACAKAERKN